MRIVDLRIENIRIIERAELSLGPRLNWLMGRNGAGKTSVLEAVSLLSAGRSFRTGHNEGVVRVGAQRCAAFARIRDESDALDHRVGLGRSRSGFEGRLDGERIASLAVLFERCPAVFVSPDAGALISGGGEARRRALDWGLFHVEPDFQPVWRRFQRALKQRNALLRQRGSGSELSAWDAEFAEAGEQLHRLRCAYVDALRPFVAETCSAFLSDQAGFRLNYRPGWALDRGDLGLAVAEHQASERRQGYSLVGPQRAGWVLSFDGLAKKEMFSRGQSKLAALAFTLGQVAHFRQVRSQSPIVCLDDVLAELDAANQVRLMGWLDRLACQVLLCAAEVDPARLDAPDTRVFHVEQGAVAPRV